MEWISVKDRLPNKDGYYLVFSKTHKDNIKKSCEVAEFILEPLVNVDKFFKCKFYRQFEQNWFNCIFKSKDITHWMELPEEPNE